MPQHRQNASPIGGKLEVSVGPIIHEITCLACHIVCFRTPKAFRGYRPGLVDLKAIGVGAQDPDKSSANIVGIGELSIVGEPPVGIIQVARQLRDGLKNRDLVDHYVGGSNTGYWVAPASALRHDNSD